MGFLDKVNDLVSKNKGTVDTAIEKAGDIVDSKTQGKYASTRGQGAGRCQERRRQGHSAAELNSQN